MHLELIRFLDIYLLRQITSEKELARFRAWYFRGSKAGLGLPGDIFRKLYPPPLLHREFSGQSRMIPQILRFRSSAREFQLRRTDLTATPWLDGRIRLRESSCLRETFDYVNADFEQWISTLNGKCMKNFSSWTIEFRQVCWIRIFRVSQN